MQSILVKYITKPKMMFLEEDAPGLVKQKAILAQTAMWKEIYAETNGVLCFKKLDIVKQFKKLRGDMEWAMNEQKSKAWVNTAQGKES